MGVQAVSSDSVLLPVGGQWLLDVEVTDLDGQAVDDVPTVVVTLPDDTTANPAVEAVTAGRYRAVYTPAVAGRYVARAATADDAADFAAHVVAPTTETGMPTAEDAVDYLGPTSHTLAEVARTLAAEAAAQRAVCRIRAVYPADLREALLRRVQRNLAMRELPLAVPQGDAEGGPSFVPGSDPEVRRLEAPHRRFAFA